jgi:glycosyltransferase involved in cell wall biosynthesis
VQDEVDGIPVTRLDYPRVRQLGAAALCARFAFWLWRRRHEYDAIHVHIAKNLAAVAGLLRPLLAATVTVKVSGAWEFDGGILDPKLRDQVVNRVYNRCIRRADKMHCLSEYTREMLVSAGYPESSLLMVPNAVDTDRFSPSLRAPRREGEPIRITYVGRLQPVKGLSILLEAWSSMEPQFRGTLTFAGDGPSQEELMQTVQERDLEDVEFLGRISDVPSVLARTDIYVQPSFQEGLPNSVLEAMAMGLPILATKVSGNEDVVTHEGNGLLVPPGDADALASALEGLIRAPALAERMGRRSREIIEESFSLPAIVRRLEQAYRGDP